MTTQDMHADPHRRSSRLAAWWLTACVVVLTLPGIGCGSPKRPGPRIVPVSGVVTYQGKPVANASVTFVMTTGKAAREPNAMTDDKGAFQLTSFDRHDGAFVGDYIVTVTKFDIDPNAPKLKFAPVTTKDSLAQLTQRALPLKYADPKTSPLRQHIAAPGKSDVKLELSD